MTEPDYGRKCPSCFGRIKEGGHRPGCARGDQGHCRSREHDACRWAECECRCHPDLTATERFEFREVLEERTERIRAEAEATSTVVEDCCDLDHRRARPPWTCGCPCHLSPCAGGKHYWAGAGDGLCNCGSIQRTDR